MGEATEGLVREESSRDELPPVKLFSHACPTHIRGLSAHFLLSVLLV